MPPAARVTDMHTCPMVTPGVPPIPHVGGPILPPGAPTVLIGFLPAARMTDMCVCVGPPDMIAKGSPTVLTGFLMQARLGDPTLHGGVIVLGCPTVIVGDAGSGGGGGGGGGGAGGGGGGGGGGGSHGSSGGGAASPGATGSGVATDAVTGGAKKSPFSGGKSAYSDKAVEVRTGVSYDGTTYNDGITIDIKCKKNPSLLQFVYREKFGADGKAIPGTITTTGGTYDFTTDPSKPNWNTDSAGKPNPAYQSGGANFADADGLTTFDQPGVSPEKDQTSRTTFKAYAVCDGKVVREISWVREQKWGSSPTYAVSVVEATKMPDWANSQMKTNGYNNAP